jgi:hypothetical protein
VAINLRTTSFGKFVSGSGQSMFAAFALATVTAIVGFVGKTDRMAILFDGLVRDVRGLQNSRNLDEQRIATIEGRLGIVVPAQPAQNSPSGEAR